MQKNERDCLVVFFLAMSLITIAEMVCRLLSGNY